MCAFHRTVWSTVCYGGGCDVCMRSVSFKTDYRSHPPTSNEGENSRAHATVTYKHNRVWMSTSCRIKSTPYFNIVNTRHTIQIQYCSYYLLLFQWVFIYSCLSVYHKLDYKAASDLFNSFYVWGEKRQSFYSVCIQLRKCAYFKFTTSLNGIIWTRCMRNVDQTCVNAHTA